MDKSVEKLALIKWTRVFSLLLDGCQQGKLLAYQCVCFCLICCTSCT